MTLTNKVQKTYLQPEFQHKLPEVIPSSQTLSYHPLTVDQTKAPGGSNVDTETHINIKYSTSAISQSEMQAEDIEIELPSPCLNGLDSALQRLGMLAATTDSRKEYLREIRRKPYLNMVRINTRYVSNVSIGFRVRPIRPLMPRVRYKPYVVKERHRTRSENNDSEKDASLVKAVVDEVIENSVELAQLKKAKSLESIVAECKPDVDLHNINFPELEAVSNCIQNLKVAE